MHTLGTMGAPTKDDPVLEFDMHAIIFSPFAVVMGGQIR